MTVLQTPSLPLQPLFQPPFGSGFNPPFTTPSTPLASHTPIPPRGEGALGGRFHPFERADNDNH